MPNRAAINVYETVGMYVAQRREGNDAAWVAGSYFRSGNGGHGPVVIYETEELCQKSVDQANKEKARKGAPRTRKEPREITKALAELLFTERKWPVIACEQKEPVKMGTTNKKTVGLLDVYENIGKREFGIASRAGDEVKFLDELATKIAEDGAKDLAIRLKGLLPLAVDLACKYRGYKAETVQERRELIAGDLVLPK